MNLKTHQHTLRRPDGTTVRRFVTGVIYRKALVSPSRVFENASLEERAEMLMDGRPTERVRHARYRVQYRIFGRDRYIGEFISVQEAAEVADSALFHLWSWFQNPDARNFNIYREGEQHPPVHPRVAVLRGTLRQEARQQGLTEISEGFTFPDRPTKHFKQCNLFPI